MRVIFFLSLALWLAGCGSEAHEPATSESDDHNMVRPSNPPGDPQNNPPDPSNNPDDPANNPDDPLPQVPARWPVESRVTHDVDSDLNAVLELQRLEGACDRYESGARDEETIMLCGKWMFFFETFGTVGIPTGILTFNHRHLQDWTGQGFSNFGFVADPTSDEGMPIGLAETTGRIGDVETRAFTCASCHFGQMDDGRFAVGWGNLNLDYGRFIATLGAPLMMAFNENDANLHPDVRAELLPYVQAAKSQGSGYVIDAGITGLGLLSAQDGAQLDLEMQESFLNLVPGTMDFLTAPLLDDGVWTVSRIMSLWNIPNEEQRAAHGMDHELLSWTGGAMTLTSFITGFVAIGVADINAWPAERIYPLEAYIRSLRTPELLTPPEPSAVERGAAVFAGAGCLDCHAGPSGEGSRPYSFDEIGTDDAMQYIFNPDENDELCCGLGNTDGDYVVTRGVKSPRLAGTSFHSRFLHNGAVDSLEALFCLLPRHESGIEAQSSRGHEFGCELPEEDRRDLIQWLHSL